MDIEVRRLLDKLLRAMPRNPDLLELDKCLTMLDKKSNTLPSLTAKEQALRRTAFNKTAYQREYMRKRRKNKTSEEVMDEAVKIYAGALKRLADK